MTNGNVPANRPADQNGLFVKIIESLKDSPAYILIFSAILLNYLFCVAALTGLGNVGGRFLVEISLIGLFLMTFAALLVVRTVEGQKLKLGATRQLESNLQESRREIESLRADLSTADALDINIENDEARSCLGEIVDNTRRAFGQDNAVFCREILYELAQFQNVTAEWARGDLVTNRDDYGRILDLFYRSATRTVFATSNQQFMDFWRRPESRNILNAHKAAYERNRVFVTRVFIFATIGEVSDEDLALMKSHAEPIYIDAKAFIVNETNSGPLASALLKDFVIIDQGLPEQVVGVTSSFERGAMGAKWTLGYEGEIEKAAQFIQNNCIEVEELAGRLQSR